MCWQCEYPDSSYNDYLDHMREMIRRRGWAVQGVERERMHPPWAYTVGLTAHGKPELVMTGLPIEWSLPVLNAVAEDLLHRDLLLVDGTRTDLGEGFVVEVVELAEPTAHLLVAVELQGPALRALQLVHADHRGHWPWEPGYRGVQGGQPVLGVRNEAATDAKSAR